MCGKSVSENCPITPRNVFRFSSDISIESEWRRVPKDAVVVRTWARNQGLDVADRGRIPIAVIKAWNVAHAD